MKCAFAIPGDLSTPTGGYGYDRRVMAAFPDLGIDVLHVALPGSFPNPPAADLAATAAALAAVPHDTVLLIDGLAYGALPEGVIQAVSAPIVALVHHPLAYEAGTPPARAAELEHLERLALTHARRVVATSQSTARLLVEQYDVPAGRLSVAMPGVDPAGRALGSGEPAPVLLSVGAISRRKGYHVLIEALAGLTDLPWRLVIAGADDRNVDMARELRGQITGYGLGDRVTLTGTLDDAALVAAYAHADLFVMPSLFEGYGMVVTEALSRGLPLVATTGGALAEVVPEDAALRVPPGNAEALRAALERMLADPHLRAAKAAAAWNLAVDLPRWPDTAATVARALKEALA